MRFPFPLQAQPMRDPRGRDDAVATRAAARRADRGYAVDRRSPMAATWPRRRDRADRRRRAGSRPAPGKDGSRRCASGAPRSRVPVVVLTARGTWRERVFGIDAGADDSPRNPSRWRSCWRLRAVLRRSRPRLRPTLSLGVEPGHARLPGDAARPAVPDGARIPAARHLVHHRDQWSRAPS